jgi:hypothetical protein
MKDEAPLITSLDGLSAKEVLRMKDVAAILKISVGCATEKCGNGTIPGLFRIGRLPRICAGDLDRHIESEKLPKNLDIFNLLDGLLPRSRRPKRNITDGRLRMTVEQLVARLKKLPQGAEIAVGGDLADGTLKLPSAAAGEAPDDGASRSNVVPISGARS